MDHQIITLSNGLRVVSARSDGNVAYIGVLTAAGSRDDFAGCDGLSHFVEHTIFKGTPSRRSWQVSARMESVGGELNAYTTKDEIMLYTNAPAGYEDRAFELIADLVMNASFPEAEIDLERGVILEEILSYRDNPSFAVFDEFIETNQCCRGISDSKDQFLSHCCRLIHAGCCSCGSICFGCCCYILIRDKTKYFAAITGKNSLVDP